MFWKWKRKRSGAGGGPRNRPIRTPDDAEIAAAEWLRHWGYSDVRAFPGGGPDGGVDLRGSGIIGQVKATSTPVGRPVVQQIFGIAAAEGATAVVFSLSGYSDQAVRWADSTGVMLYVFDLKGRPGPANWAASRSGNSTVRAQPLNDDVRADIDTLIRLTGEIISACRVVVREVGENLDDEQRRNARDYLSNMSETLGPGLLAELPEISAHLAELEASHPETSTDAELTTSREMAELNQALDDWTELSQLFSPVFERLTSNPEAMEPSNEALWMPYVDMYLEGSETMEKAINTPTMRQRMGWDAI